MMFPPMGASESSWPLLAYCFLEIPISFACFLWDERFLPKNWASAIAIAKSKAFIKAPPFEVCIHYNTSYRFCKWAILGFISVIHPISISLFIEVETESGKGILSPFGWVVPPARKYIQKFSTDGSDLNFGSARNFQNWVVFRIDNDIIRIKSKTIKQEDGYTESFCNEITLEYLFESKDVYEFMSYHQASFGINFYYRKISDNSKLGINVFCASASIVKPYSESRDYNIIGNYTDKDNPRQIDDFSDGRQILLNRDNFWIQVTVQDRYINCSVIR